MLTGMLAARNLMLGELNDLWNVNTDQEYHEEMPVESEVPEPAIADVLQGVLSEAFPKLDRVALGLSMGAVGGMALFLATLFLVMKGGDVIGPNLQLLNQYFPGYSVTMLGASLGLGYGFGGGFASGWSFAFFRNASLFLYVAVTRRRAERQILRKLLEYF